MLDIAITVLIARMIPHDLRPRMCSMIATAWIVPSLVGPGIAGLIAEQYGWRAVFLVGAVARTEGREA